MTAQFIVGFGKEALELTLMLSAPVLVTALVVGLLVSIFQAATQIQEMTLVFVPKIVTVIAALILCAPWLLSIMTNYTTKLFMNIPLYIR
ncbi:MAG: flagellar biosynthesis protein FliQ [bacterium]|nr:flagellar biosynthesis protein FliQ [bacterium]